MHGTIEDIISILIKHFLDAIYLLEPFKAFKRNENKKGTIIILLSSSNVTKWYKKYCMGMSCMRQRIMLIRSYIYLMKSFSETESLEIYTDFKKFFSKDFQQPM